MRIIAGTAGGRRLKTLPGDQTRPTADRVKEAVFSTLGSLLLDSRVLDGFAGSAALGLESLSRGAAEVWFCEKNPAAQKICAENIKSCGLGPAHLLKGELISTLRRLRETEPKLQFDLVFLDPPYRSELLRQSMEELLAGDWLAEQGIVIAESARNMPPVPLPEFCVIKEKFYGDTAVRYYRRRGDTE